MSDIDFGNRLADDLKRDEGVRYKLYRDTEGKWTIGYGHNIEDRGITPSVAEMILDEDIAVAVRDLDNCVPWWRQMPETARRALANMCFQLGWPRLSAFVKMLEALQAGDWEVAASEALDSRYAKQAPGRAARIAALYRRAGLRPTP